MAQRTADRFKIHVLALMVQRLFRRVAYESQIRLQGLRRVPRSSCNGPLRTQMPHQVRGDDQIARSYPLAATRIASISLALAVVLGGLPFIERGWFDLQWFAALSSAWINVFTVAIAARLTDTGGLHPDTKF